MPTTDVQREAADRIAAEYDASVRITPNAGPLRDLMVVSAPDGRLVVITATGDILADSARNAVQDQAIIAGFKTVTHPWGVSWTAVDINDPNFGSPDRPLAVAEDPVRKAARQQLALDPEHTSVALAEALAEPAPPSLTEDERKALIRATNETARTISLPKTLETRAKYEMEPLIFARKKLLSANLKEPE